MCEGRRLGTELLGNGGCGSDFSKYCGELDRKLTAVIDILLALNPAPPLLTRLVEFLKQLGPRAQWIPKDWSKARVAVMTAISRHRSATIAAISQTDIEELEGRL